MFEIGRQLAAAADYQAAKVRMRRAGLLYEELDSLRLVANCINNIGLYCYYLGEYDSAEIYYVNAIKIDSIVDNKEIIGRYVNLGILEKKKGFYANAIRHYSIALGLANKYKEEQLKFRLFYSIGNLLKSQRRYDEALNYHKMALSGWRYSGDSLRESRALTNIGNDFLGLEEWDSAIYSYQESIRIKKQLKNKPSLAIPFNNLGEAYLKRGMLDSAGFYLHEAESLKRDRGNLPSLLITTNNLAALYLAIGDAPKTVNYLNYDTAALTNPDIKLQNLDIRRRYHEWLGQPAIALTYHKQWSILQDSLFEEGRLATLTEIAATEKEDLSYQKKISDQQLEIERSRSAQRGIVLVAAALLLGVFGFFLYRNDKQKRMIEQLNGELRLLNRDMYHRKRNDYHRIVDLLDRSNFPAADSVKNMLYASASVDETLYDESTESKNIQPYLEELLMDLAESLQLVERQITIYHSIESAHLTQEVATRVGFVISELITNTAKHSFSQGGGRIELRMEAKDGQLVCCYKDNGTPFPEGVPSAAGGLGLGLIHGFLASLKSQLVRKHDKGWNEVRFVISVE